VPCRSPPALIAACARPPVQIVLRPAVELVESALVARGFLAPSAPGRSPWPGNAARAGLVLATGGVAALVPHFGLLTDLFAGVPALWLRAWLHDRCTGLRGCVVHCPAHASIDPSMHQVIAAPPQDWGKHCWPLSSLRCWP